MHLPERRFVNAPADRDRPARDVHARVEEQVPPDDDHLAAYGARDFGGAADDDDGLVVGGVTRENSGMGAVGADEHMRRGERAPQPASGASRAHVANHDGLRGGSAGGERRRRYREADDSERDGDAARSAHRAASRKFASICLPCWVMIDSGWNWTPKTGSSACRTA